jgi:hypothetical protein
MQIAMIQGPMKSGVPWVRRERRSSRGQTKVSPLVSVADSLRYRHGIALLT